MTEDLTLVVQEVEAGRPCPVLATGVAQVTVLQPLTVAKLAAKLKEIEFDHGLGTALRCVDRLDYGSVCALTESGKQVDEPARMPGRFMVLAGAKDADLKNKGNLDAYPYPVASGLPDGCEVATRAGFLALLGELDGARPEWWTGPKGGRTFADWDAELVDAANAQIADADPLQPQAGVPPQHVVAKGDTFLSIAEQYAIRSWTLVWEANKSSISDPTPPLAEGSTLVLPQWQDDAVSDFESWIQGFAGDHLADGAGFHDPRSVLLNEAGLVVVRMVEVADIHFLLGGHMACIDGDGQLVEGIATALWFGSVRPELDLVVFGHADTSAEPSFNNPLSLRRAKAVQSLLDPDPDTWVDLSNTAKTEEIQSILQGLATGQGWPCDPGSVDGILGDATKSAIQSFQQEANRRYSLGLAEDGDCGPATWRAIHRAICGAIAQRLNLQDPTTPDLPLWEVPDFGYPEGDGVFPCGESFPIQDPERDNFRSQVNRRVELIFGYPGVLDLAAPTATARNLRAAECPIYDPDKTVRLPAPDLGPRDIRFFSI